MIRHKKKNQMLADTISNTLNAIPSVDPEDDENYTAEITEGALEDLENDGMLLSQFRKQNINFFDDVDVKYAGKQGSRESLRSNDDEDWVPDNIQDNIVNEEALSDISYDSNQDDSSLSCTESEGEDAEDSTNEIDDYETLNNNNLKQKLEHDSNTQVQKGTCVRRQLSIWENLLEIRIQLQKCLITANKVPQSQVFKQIRRRATAKFDAKVNETKNNIETVLNKLLELQSLLLKQYAETRKLSTTSERCTSGENDDSDEEIESDAEVENQETNQQKEEIPRKRRKLSDYENEIKENHDNYRSYRNSVIQKWNDKTRVAIVKNNNPVHSVLNQIEHVLSDKQKLIRRTQTKRSHYDIVGKNSVLDRDKSSETNEEFDVEIFDDDDFYHQLLRELIEAKSSDVTDPSKLGRQWIQLQNMRSKMKRNIDTRATKGRKIRYTVHTKLVNFMAPIDHSSSTEEARTELYSSLFGKNCVYKL